jgi:hypothetical protein
MVMKRKNLAQKYAMIAVTIAAFLGGVDIAVSQVLITGDRNSLTIELRSATISELLSTLHQKFGIDYKSTPSLDQRIDGQYSGTLKRALSRILMGYDYVIRSSGSDMLWISVIAKSDATVVAPAPANIANSRPFREH